MKIAAAILAGGQSRRMGRDKANLPSLHNPDMTMLQRTVELASAVFDSVFVVGRTKPEDWAMEGNAVFLPDEMPDQGPAGGLLTVLRVLRPQETAAVALIACDMPLLTADSLQWLHDAAQGALGRHGLVTRNGSQIEPLFAVYMADCLPLVERQLAEGRRSLQKLIEAGDFTVMEAPAEAARTLLNVNTAEDLAQARSLAEGLRGEISSSGTDGRKP